jgi:hypothetical protein
LVRAIIKGFVIAVILLQRSVINIVVEKINGVGFQPIEHSSDFLFNPFGVP